MKRIFFAAIMLLLSLPSRAQEVYLIPTLHRLHQSNEQYNYDSLRAWIASLQPDILAVEIRREDLEADMMELKKNYPYEMWMARYWFPDKMIAGFDWLDSDIEGKKIPENYWQEASAIKLLQKALNSDSAYRHVADTCANYTTERLQLLKTLSLPALLKSKDAFLANQYYECLSACLSCTPYAGIPEFFELRNQKLLANIIAIHKRYPGKKIVVLTGADHYAWLISRLPHVPLRQ